jgi:hypothetical protein
MPKRKLKRERKKERWKIAISYWHKRRKNEKNMSCGRSMNRGMNYLAIKTS